MAQLFILRSSFNFTKAHSGMGLSLASPNSLVTGRRALVRMATI